ncbi:hypothetical protein [Paraburkholderia rhynchosiae]|uniref:hypothetical protein n=1 Tax=Paraburkholderia rhynchosiae TaxID=487049 RepID=UPI0011AF5D03|nr:hypothetical protein [Paraburkholderia rhynchosiae]
MLAVEIKSFAKERGAYADSRMICMGQVQAEHAATFPMSRCTKAQKHKSTKAQKHKSTKAQKHKSTSGNHAQQILDLGEFAANDRMAPACLGAPRQLQRMEGDSSIQVISPSAGVHVCIARLLIRYCFTSIIIGRRMQ